MASGRPDPNGFQITPEEERFLRAFFRRHAGRTLALVSLLGFAAVAVALAAAPRTESDAEAWSSAAGELRARDEALGSELGAARAESQKLRTELRGLAQKLGSLDGAAGGTRALERRLAKALERLERLETRVGRVEKGVEGLASAPPGAAAPAALDLGALHERLDSIEARQDIEAQGRENFEKSVLNRLYAVETRIARQASSPPPPSAPRR